MSNEIKNQNIKGKFADRVDGINYKTQTLSGVTDKEGKFEYRQGETITFSIGKLVIGSAIGKELITTADIVYSVGGDIKKIKNRVVTNLSRFVQSLCGKIHLEKGFCITNEIVDCINKYYKKINFDQEEDAFTKDAIITVLMEELNYTLRSPEHARNHLRRTMNGIRKLTDVKIPTRDDSYLLADVYLPIKAGKYPVIMSHAGYGKAFWFGCISNETEFQKHEKMEDNYFEGIKESTPFIDFHIQLAGEEVPDQLPPGGTEINPLLDHVSEGFEIANTFDWVPDGYIVIRVDGRGTGNTPGMFEQFSKHEAEDYYDAIEWAGTHEWSNGNVGLYGASYYAMDMISVSSLQPPHLKAMIPIAGDVDYYRDVLYSGGGLFSPFSFIAKHSCGEWKGVDFVNIAKEQPFDEPDKCPCYSSNPDDIKVPFLAVMPLECPGLHTRGTSELYINAVSENKKLMICSEVGVHFWMYKLEIVNQHKAFMAYWLKDEKNTIMDEAPVKMMIRTGIHGFYWKEENEWPVARTEYRKLYLNADAGKLQKSTEEVESKVEYKADDMTSSITFISDAMEEDTTLAGYFKLKLFCSSTTEDMAVKVNIRVLDEDGEEVPYDVQYTVPKNPINPKCYPVTSGSLKISHRKLDAEKSTEYRPYHTHKSEDYRPLCNEEIVECDIEIWPSTVEIRKGWRLCLEIVPAEDVLNNSYQKNAKNKIYTGNKYNSYLQVPVI
ncbi:CocE/NonD family hydrolase [Clostridium estertheticum]|uniref:CocE/NonD family hydrolase n=1 Tax=Clostridium estertheticum TaxID=238834 RepID=UPI001C7E1381|nr:CocE/NonD family hydrolase [Clostridium estertheticum]MBX4270036.1 CocE/NonD family hydrolase [Clostridium estertheticum]WLC80243.1 CocE/NonD family hydrolase [Clostridium estertheticum]